MNLNTQNTILEYMFHTQSIFRERLVHGHTQFDTEIIKNLKQCRNVCGHATTPISYYSVIRSKHLDQRIEIVHDPPYLKGYVSWKDPHKIFKDLHEPMNCFADRMADLPKMPIDIDVAWTIGEDTLKIGWYHDHFHDIAYDSCVGYFRSRPALSGMSWEFTIHGVAQVYKEGVSLLRWLDWYSSKIHPPLCNYQSDNII